MRDIAGKTTGLNLQIFAFEALPRFTQGRAHDCRVAYHIARSSTRNLGREHIDVDPADSISRSQNNGAFNDIAALPDIAWPFHALKCRLCVRSNLWHRPLGRGAWRERGGQLVAITVVGVRNTKKKKN